MRSVLDYYNLTEQPFGVTPDPRFLYLSGTHGEAMASALYGIEAGRGFAALIAPPGMGKTTLLFELLRKYQASATTVFIFQSPCSPRDLLDRLLTDLGVEHGEENLAGMHSKLNELLLRESRRGKRLIVVIDEAQNLEDPVLEAVRMLSNFETPREKLMHVILAGQPRLAERLATGRLVQLRQRISIVSRLMPFNAEDTQFYIDHRLRVAGYDFVRPLFARQASATIAEHSLGIPRNISNICFNAISLGYVAKQKTIDKDIIQEVLNDLDLFPLFEDHTNVRDSERPSPSITTSPSNAPERPAGVGKWEKASAPISRELVRPISVRNLEKPAVSIPNPPSEEQARPPNVNVEKPSQSILDPVSNERSRPFLPGWPLSWTFDPDHVGPRAKN
jgi:general secretion pathway protein A